MLLGPLGVRVPPGAASPLPLERDEMTDTFIVYEPKRTMEVSIPTGYPAAAWIAPTGGTTVVVSSGGDNVRLQPGEDAIFENGRIVPPRRVLNERLASLTARLANPPGTP